MDATTIQAIKTRLMDQVVAVNRRVFVTSDEALVPMEMPLPCLGLVDQGTEYALLDSDTRILTHLVSVIAYVQNLADPEAPILGRTASSEIGVLTLIQQILTALKEERLDAEGATGIQDVNPVAESAVGLLLGEQDAIVYKAIQLRYEQRVAL